MGVRLVFRHPLRLLRRPLLAAALTVPGLTARARDDAVDWNQFRGPNGQGVSDADLTALEFGPEKNVLWKTQLPPGQSSPVICGGRIFLTACEPKNWKRLITLCVDRRSGEVLWRKVTSTGTKGRYHPMNGPACPTPAVDRERVYVYFPTWGLVCYDHGGERLWERKLETPKNQFGTSASPILYQELVILLLDGNNGKSRLLAVSRLTGETVWEQPRPLCKAGWSTPMIWGHDRGDEIIVLGYKRLASYDPNTGSEIWYAGGFSPETIGVPVAGRGFLFVSAAALAGRGELKWDTALTWKTTLRHFDRNKDGMIQRDEATKGFRIVLRPDLEPSNPGYGFPMRDSSWLDKDKDGAITEDEWVRSTSGFAMQGKPTLLAVRPGARGDARKTHVAWELNSRVPESPSILLCKGRLYLLRDGGRLI